MNRIILNGIAGSPGLVEGRAWIIKDPEKTPKDLKPDYIMVADHTSPVLALALRQAKAIVCEKGTTTSHAAVVAREFGIPCLVSVKNALATIKNDDFLVVDADEGKVIIN
ncbi:MAG: PEP-utilizing enzyme [Patescibacteria group bacterium]